jgi:hypothetical protein
MATQKRSIITKGMKENIQKKGEIKKTGKEFTPEQEAFMNGGDKDLVANKKEQTEEKKGRGRPASNIKKRKVTFDLSEDLITELDKVALFYGMNRAQFVSQAVMKAVREAQRTENL